MTNMSLPYLASNGGMVVEANQDVYHICLPEATVIVRISYDDWAVEFPPNWLHTPEEGEFVGSEAMKTLRDYFSCTKDEDLVGANLLS